MIKSNYKDAKIRMDQVGKAEFEYSQVPASKIDNVITYEIFKSGKYISEFRLPYGLFFITHVEFLIKKDGLDDIVTCEFPIKRIQKNPKGYLTVALSNDNKIMLDKVTEFWLKITMINDMVEPKPIQVIYGLVA